jgi:transposase InsO family protein
MADPVLLMTKLRDIAFNKRSRKKPTQSSGTVTAMSTNTCTRTRTGCCGTKHNPATKTHTEENCWAIYPEKKEKFLAAQNAAHHHTSAAPLQTSSSQSQHQVPAFAAVTVAHSFSTQASVRPAVLDSGASHHMLNDPAFFKDTEVCSIPISTGQNSTDLTATRVGTAVIAQSDRYIMHLVDALFVPSLSQNLLSLAKLVKKTVSITKDGNISHIVIDGDIIFDCVHRNDILEVSGHIGPVPNDVLALISTTHSTACSVFDVWHNRLGHAGIARIQATLPDIKMVKSSSCDSCMKGKVACIPFSRHFDATHHPLEVVHSDLVGPITPSTNSGARYFITLVDQHTGFISVTLLQRKSDATKAILEFKTFYEKQTGFAMKKLITDGGGEFCNKNLSSILQSRGIQHNVAPPYTPQHNGVAEQANKTIIKMARCMLVQSHLAKEWWGEAVRTATLTTNCLPSLSKSRVSPLEQLMKKVPNMAFFQPFGCKTWVIKPAEKRTSKFDSIAWDAILLGYSNDYLCYRVIKVESMEITDTKQAYFDESVFPPLRAINPSPDLAPHSRLPDFISNDLLPYNDDEDLPPRPAHVCSLHENEVMDEDPFKHEDEVMFEGEDASGEHGWDEDMPPSGQSAPEGGSLPQRLILCLGPHPTRIDSDINPSNIISRQTRFAQAFSVTSTEPSNHQQAMACDDREEWKKAE